MWRDAWVGGNGTGKLITPVRILDQNATVDVLLDIDNHRWRTEVMSEVLFPIDIDRILQIPISTSGSPDQRVWAANEDGIFRVREAYSLALRAQTETSSSNGNDSIWRAVWKLHIHPKVKIFLWRAIWDILPHGSNLRKKGIENVGSCARCGGMETNMHVLKDCDWARKVWLKLMPSSDIPHQGTFRDWFGSLLGRRKQNEVEMFGVCAWQIWSARNDLCFEKLHVSPDQCYKRASDMLMEYKKATCCTSSRNTQRDEAHWSPPEAGYIKVNVDASVNVKECRIGIGVVARNNDGEVLLSASKTVWPFISVERAEIEAFQWALMIIQESQWQNIIVEGDAQNVVKALNGTIVRGFHNQILVDNIRNAANVIQQISFNFCFREANNVAHRLAKWASANVCSNVWCDGGPSWIMDIVFSDLAI